MGAWMKKYGETIYGTNGGYVAQQKWGVITQTQNKMYIHVLDTLTKDISLPSFPFKKIKKVYSLNNPSQKINYSFKNNTLTINKGGLELPVYDDPDKIVVVDIE